MSMDMKVRWGTFSHAQERTLTNVETVDTLGDDSGASLIVFEDSKGDPLLIIRESSLIFAEKVSG
jgi:hypothetical protein